MENNFEVWDTDILPANEIGNRGYIQIDDYYRFNRITDVANQLFFKNYKGYQQAAFNTSMNGTVVKVWFPTISSKEKNEHKQWLNYLNDDWSEISEVNIREDEKVIKHELGELRIVFAKIKDSTGIFSYRYIGNFELKEVSNDNKVRRYAKISDRLYIDYDNEKINM